MPEKEKKGLPQNGNAADLSDSYAFSPGEIRVAVKTGAQGIR